MNLPIKIFLLCPVPEEQKPINDYIQLKENEATRWVAFSESNYRQTLGLLAGGAFFFFSLLNFSSVEGVDYFFDWILSVIIQTCLFLFFLLFINFVRWKEIEIRFQTARLFYEEASWYDGRIWEKPFSIVKNDKLLSTQKIQPILRRLLGTMGILLSFVLLFGLVSQLG
jgi:hypothetical protein